VNDNGHLTEDRIIKAVADKATLSVAEKEHLPNCSGCSSALESFGNDLYLLGKIAETSVPSPKKRFNVHEKRAERNFPGIFGLQASLAAAITVLFFSITLHSDSMKSLLTTETGSYIEDIYSDDLVTGEISPLAENALLLEYVDIYGEADPDYNDNFIDYIFPSSGDNTISETREGEIV